jgi:branched-chain amino acid:cation transporter, LIVCS family
MVADKSPSTLVVGLALFAMFFGAGNLIFPLMLGAKYENQFLICAIGFIITAVLLPTLGILAMIFAHGRYEKLFTALLPNKISRYFFLIVLLFWIPLGSGPRCVVLAHASISAYIPVQVPIWLFSLIFLSLVYVSVKSRRKIIDILGKFLTPILLISILFIVFTSFLHGEIEVKEVAPIKVFIESVVDGYYTQDLIAAIFFSSAVLGMLNLSNENQKTILKKTLSAGLIAVALLAVLYTCLIGASAIHAEYLRDLSGEKLVSALAQIALGNTFGGISSAAVSLACLTTEIALVLVFADFLNKEFFHSKKFILTLSLTIGLIWVMSQLEFGGIMAIISPAMKIIYPILFVLVLRLIWRSRNQFME